MINKLKRIIAGLQITMGIQSLKDLPTFEVQKEGGGKIGSAINNLKLGLANTQLDMTYAYTSWDNWQEIIDILYGRIIKNFKWTAEYFDCDNRAMLFSSLCSVCFNINTCGQVYCEVYDDKGVFKYLHWANIIVDKEGNLYLLDCDNQGRFTKITSSNIILGSFKYKLISLRIG